MEFVLHRAWAVIGSSSFVRFSPADSTFSNTCRFSRAPSGIGLELDACREVLPDEAVCVLDGATLPERAAAFDEVALPGAAVSAQVCLGRSLVDPLSKP